MDSVKVKRCFEIVFRVIIGLTFIFSGFVKSVDPYGTAFKIEEYLNVFGFNFLLDIGDWVPLVISIALCSLEFIIGIMLVSFVFKTWVNWITVIMMVFFTVLTFLDAMTNKVSDCGCFGDAIKLTNWETFWKNIVLDGLLIVVLILSNKERRNRLELLYSDTYKMVVIVLVLCFSTFNAVYEPLIDFRPWKEGNRIAPRIEDQKPPISYAEYKNNSTGEVKEFDMDELMKAYEQDTAFATNWTFVNSRVINSNKINADGFSMQGFGSTKDEALEILSQKDTLFMLVVVELDKASNRSMKRVKEFKARLANGNYKYVVLTSSAQSKWEAWKQKHSLKTATLYSSDDKALKTMIRSCPGVVMMCDGVVLEKWSWRYLPELDKK